MLLIYGFNIEENEGHISLPELLPYVSQDKQHRIKAFRSPVNIKQVLLGDLLIRSVVCRSMNITNEDLQFQVNKYGKPCLSGFQGNHFSLSHSGKWIICAYSDHIVGVDIEEIGPVDMDVAFEYFSPEEIGFIVGMPLRDRVAAFYDIWTYKESYIKALGCGLSKDLKSFSVSPITGDTATVSKTVNDSQAFLRQYYVSEKYRLSVCAFGHDFPESVQIVGMQWILDTLNNQYKA